jgi:hypothetical protein
MEEKIIIEIKGDDSHSSIPYLPFNLEILKSDYNVSLR